MKSIDCWLSVGTNSFFHPNSIHWILSDNTTKKWEKIPRHKSIRSIWFSLIFLTNAWIMEFMCLCVPMSKYWKYFVPMICRCSNSTVTTIKTTTTVIRLHLFISNRSTYEASKYDLQIFGFFQRREKKSHTQNYFSVLFWRTCHVLVVAVVRCGAFMWFRFGNISRLNILWLEIVEIF